MDQYLHVQSLVNANLHKSLDIALNGPIFIRSTSRQCKSSQISWHRTEWTNIHMFKVPSMQIFANLLTSHWMDQYLNVQSLVNTNLLTSHWIDQYLNVKVLSTQISWHHIEWTNIRTFKVLSMQIFTDLLTSHWMDQYSHIQSLVNANLSTSYWID